VYFKHPLVKQKTIEERDYQKNIAKACLKRSTLVVLPTGLGKTVIALMVLVDRLKKGKVLFLAPTRPLVAQHASFLSRVLNIEQDDIALFTGNVPPKKRTEVFEGARIIVSTPQVIENDLISGRISLGEVSFIIFDEAHRGVGNYAYVFIAERYRQERADDGLVLGITASPGSSAEKILEVCENLGIEGVEIRSEYDADVYNYVQHIKISWVEVELQKEAKRIRDLLNEVYVEHLKKLQKWGFLSQTTMVSKKMLLDVQKRIQGRIFATKSPPKSLFYAAALQSAAMKLNHGMELAETQGIYALREYFERLDKEAHARGGGKAAKLLLADERVRMAIRLTEREQSEHPKLKRVIGVVQDEFRRNPDSRIIVFTHYRDTSEMVTEALSKLEGVRPIRFVGQASKGEDKGMTQKVQVEAIKKFEAGEYNVLVATSVAEEGLDIPATDLVVFYEPVPSEIRTIQRRGRTGRKHAGRVVILITKGTRDTAYYWASVNKEKSMKRELRSLREALKEKIEVDHSLKIADSHTAASPTDKTKTTASTAAPSSTAPVLPSASKTHSSTPETTPPVSPSSSPAVTTAPPTTASAPSIIKGQTHIFDFRPEKRKGESREKAEKLYVGEDTILVDTREFNSPVVRELSRMGYTIRSELLEIGDYILSDRVCVERKTVEDFLVSLKDGRLFQQMSTMKRAFLRPVVIIEGKGLFESGGINPASIYGAIASIISDYGIPIIQSKDAVETASLLSAMSKREYAESRPLPTRVDIGASEIGRRQLFLVEGLPGVSAVLARRLLEHFGSVRAVMTASEEELMQVKGVGKKIAAEIVRVLEQGYLRKKGNGNSQSDIGDGEKKGDRK